MKKIFITILLICLMLSSCTVQPDSTADNNQLDAMTNSDASFYNAFPAFDNDIFTSPQPVTLAATAHFQYGRSFLDNRQQILYDNLYQAAESWNVPLLLPLSDGDTDEAASQIITYFTQDNPQFYWCTIRLEQDETTGMRFLTLDIVPELTVELAVERSQIIQQAASVLLEQYTGSSVDVVYGIHDYLAEYVYYEGDPDYVDSGNIYGGLVSQRVICDGYAKTFQYLMQQAGLDCIYIQGTVPGGASHAWNAVRLEDGWYYIDVTWDVNKAHRSQVFHDYCAVSLDEISREHFQDPEQYPALPASAPETGLNYYQFHSYTVTPDIDSNSTQQLASAFLTALVDADLHQPAEPVFLEIKVLGSSENYQQTKDIFIKDIYILLALMNEEAARHGLPFTIKTTGAITCNFNDTMQILLLYPVVQPDYNNSWR